MKKFLAMMMTCAMTLSCLNSVAFASEPQGAQEYAPVLLSEQTSSEYDMYVEMKEDSGDAIINDQKVEDILMQRASLPKDVLKDEYGYSDDQIQILKEYDGTPIEENPQLRGIFANVDGYLYLMEQSNDSVTVRFYWRWDTSPLLAGAAIRDVVTCAWIGVDSGNDDHALRLVEEDSICEVDYYYKDEYRYREEIELDDTNPDQSTEAKFTVGSSQSDVYAKVGYMDVTVKEPVNVKDLQYSTFVFAYGHTTLTLNPSFSVSVDGISVSLSPGFGTEEMFNGSISVWENGDIDYGGDAWN